MCNDTIKQHRFDISAPTEVAAIVEQIRSLQTPYLLGFVFAYIHNTVIVQTLKRELEAKIPDMRLSLRKHEEKRGAKLVVYEFVSRPFDDDLYAEAIACLQTQVDTLQKELEGCKSDLVKKYFYDHLTDIPNIFKLRKDLQEFSDVTLIDVSVDDFKYINSFYGFLVGDYVLEQVASFLTALEGVDTYKMPGGEFILLLQNHLSYYELKSYIEELYKKLGTLEIRYNEIQINIDFTLGACTAHSIEHILAKLSKALTYAKENKLPFFIYEDRLEFYEDYQENLRIIGEIRDAIKHDRIVAYYQPIIDNATQEIVKFETLARLIGSDATVLAPDRFLEMSKKTKLYHTITKKMIQSAMETFVDTPYDFCINIAKEDILNQETYDFIIETLRKSRISDRVIFELVESDALSQTDRVLEFVNEVKRYGAKIAIDDFGSGYSNFSMLMKMKVDYIKIDGALIAEIDTNLNSLTVVESIVAFAKKLHIRVVAEYVYSSTILSKVKALGIEYSQGFYIDKPRIDIKKTAL